MDKKTIILILLATIVLLLSACALNELPADKKKLEQLKAKEIAHKEDQTKIMDNTQQTNTTKTPDEKLPAQTKPTNEDSHQDNSKKDSSAGRGITVPENFRKFCATHDDCLKYCTINFETGQRCLDVCHDTSYPELCSYLEQFQGKASENKERADAVNAFKNRDQEIISQLPDCNNPKFTVPPADLNDIIEISPLGAINPPGHTLPTPHLYFHISVGQQSTKIVDLKAPADIYIISVSSDSDDLVPERTEYSIGFALCKDVFGYFNHVKEISEELKKELAKDKCETFTDNHGNSCAKKIVYKAAAGTVIGGVGHKQGNFDFGAYDFRKQLGYVNTASYGDLQGKGFGRPRLLYAICPLELYDTETKERFYSKISRTIEPICGDVMQDVPSSLQGSWFYEDGRADMEWSKHLTFGHDSMYSNKAIIAVAGIITRDNAAIKWMFSPKESGTNNRRFSDVKNDGNIYCYDDSSLGSFGTSSGKILVQLTSNTELKIEYKDGSCSGNLAFDKPFSYHR